MTDITRTSVRGRARAAVLVTAAVAGLLVPFSPANAADPAGTVLYDQDRNSINLYAISSQNSPPWFEFLADERHEAADDFTVPAGHVWSIDTVRIAEGSWPRVSTRYTVTFYGDDAGRPGAAESTVEVGPESFTRVPVLPDVQTSLRLDPPVLVDEGTHWLSIVGHSATSDLTTMIGLSSNTHGSHRWFKRDVWLQFDSCDVSWCAASAYDMRFTLFGTETSSATNTAPTVTIENAPTATVEGNTAGGADLTSGPVVVTDLEDDPAPVATCTDENGVHVASSPWFFELGIHTVTCTATDTGGLTGSDSVTFEVVDTTAPSLEPHGDEAATASGIAGAAVTYTSPGSSDIVDAHPTVACAPASGSTFPPGDTTVTCTATDAAGNTAQTAFTVTVTFASSGLTHPINSPPALNPAKSGATVPVKWSIGDGGGGFVIDVATVESISQTELDCSTGAVVGSEQQTAATGGGVVRWDETARQFIYNWKTPSAPNTCWRLSVNLIDGTSQNALFKLR